MITSLAGQKDLPRWFGPSFRILQNLRAGRVEILLPDGREFLAEGRDPGPHGRMEIRNPAFFSRILRQGELGFAESYMDGWWDTPDLQALMDVILMSNSEVARGLTVLPLVRAYERLRHRLRDNSPSQARRNIAAHYDLGNAFYARWLDETMTYSSALFQTGSESLPEAQRKKYAAICDRIGAKPGDHVLEIGCGWGGFAEYAAAERGVKVTGLTISMAQAEFARARIHHAGLAERVDIQVRDYRDETGRYDSIASIEMFEAVGERYWPAYFDTVRDRLRPGGTAALQIITIADGLFARYRRSVDFVQKYIFPGGMLPSRTVLADQIRRAGLVLEGDLAFGQSYSDTLRRWRGRFNERWDDIRAMGFDDRFGRMWNFYLAVCASTFRNRTTDVAQFALRRP